MFFLWVFLCSLRKTKRKWLGPESNQLKFQSSALPTELPATKKIKLQERQNRNLPGSFQNK